MKIFPYLLITGLLAGPALALEPAELATVSKRFASPSGDEQYKARIELNRLVDQATLPGKGDPAAVTQMLIDTILAETTPLEAKKYLLRALGRVGTAKAADALTAMLANPSPLLENEARCALESIRDPKTTAALEATLRTAKDKDDKLGLANSLATQHAVSAVPLLAPLLADPDPETARSAMTALAGIGGPEASGLLAKALASGKIAAALTSDLELALLAAAPTDPRGAMRIYQSTKSDQVKHTAFLMLTETAPATDKPALIEGALKSDSDKLRHAALAAAVRSSLRSLQTSLSDQMAQMPVSDRLVVLANIHLFKPVELAEKVALASLTASDEAERINALAALGRIATQPAFKAVLQALGAREPRINQAAATALGSMKFAGAEDALLVSLKEGSGTDKILAIKALLFRQVPGSNAILIEIIKGTDSSAAKEAMKTIYSTATIDDLRTLCATATAAKDPAFKRSLSGICSKIATRINTDAAREAVKPLK